jgi:Tfp pilus assembly protein PilN
MSNQRLLTILFGVATVSVAALGSIHVMKLRMEADVIGNRIVRLERSMAESKKELIELKRQREQSQDTLQLQQRIGDTLKSPTAEQVIWMHIPMNGFNPVYVNQTTPRSAAHDIAFLHTAGPGGNNSR